MIRINDVDYEVPVGDVVATYSRYEGLIFRRKPPMMRPVNRCSLCGRFDDEEIVARSLEEAVEVGMLVLA